MKGWKRVTCCLLLAGAAAVWGAAGYAADGYKVLNATTSAINEWGVCRRITNNTPGGTGLFVPTKYRSEWINSPTSFLSSTLPDVSVNACLDVTSVRLRSGAGAYFSRTPASAGDQKTWTWSGWVKRGALSMAADSHILSARSGTNPLFLFRFGSNDTLNVFARNSGGSTIADYTTTSVFRDPSAWYHIVLQWDAANASMALSVNGMAQPLTVGTAISNVDYAINGMLNHEIGRHAYSGVEHFDGSMAEVHFVDGQSLPPSAFAEADSATGQWMPKVFGGSFGTNGYRLSFSNVGTLGEDSSGNGNHWTPNNFSATAGATYDPLSDYTRPLSNEGANGIGNYATLNPLPIWAGYRATLSNGNLTAVTGANVQGGPSRGTIPFPSIGKWYFEGTLDSGAYAIIGISKQSAIAWADGVYWSSWHGRVYRDSDGGTVTTSIAVNDVVGVAVDSDAGEVGFYKNGVHQITVPYNRMREGDFVPTVQSANSGGSVQFTMNFGQRAFAHAPPSGFKALNTYNLPAPAIITPTAYFKPITYTGNGGYLSVGNPVALTGGANVSASLRFEAAGSSALSRLYGTTGNTNRFTLAFWIKKNSLTTQDALIGCTNDASNFTYIRFAGGTAFNTRFRIGGTDYQSSWPVAFQDPAAWHHIVYVYDRQNATAADRQILYVDGVRIVPTTVSNPTTNLNSWGTARTHYIGFAAQNAIYLDAYLADFHYVDGEAMAATDFGQFNSAGVWVPKAYGGAYGTNGARLTFDDKSNTTATTLGADSSGNGNNWTPSGFSVAVGFNDDVVRDVPAAYVDGNGEHGNFATLNPLDKVGTVTLGGGNMHYAVASGGQVRGTLGTAPNSGKWYWEYTATSAAAPAAPQGFGLSTLEGPITNNSTSLKKAVYAYINAASTNFYEYYLNGAAQLGMPTLCFTTMGINEVMKVAYEAETGKVWLGKNTIWCDSSGGTTGNPATGANPTVTILPGDRMAPFLENIGATYSGVFNAGQKPFTYGPPSGFMGLSTANAPSSDFVPDLVLIKSRSAATDWAWYDRERGPTLELASNSSGAETVQSTGLLGFQAGGFTAGGLSKLNTNAATYIAYLFKKGVTPGFDIVTYTGTGSARTVPHSLGAVPEMVLVKRRGATDGWAIIHKGMNASPANGYIDFSTAAFASQSAPWNNTAPTSTEFTVGSSSRTNDSGSNYVAYLWSEVPGFSKFGGYTGNGNADGPFVYTGFRPAFVMVKRTNSTGNWLIFDGNRNPYNLVDKRLWPNLTNAESTSTDTFDFLSNGFKARHTGSDINASGGTYIYAAFAEAPFKYSNAR